MQDSEAPSLIKTQVSHDHVRRIDVGDGGRTGVAVGHRLVFQRHGRREATTENRRVGQLTLTVGVTGPEVGGVGHGRNEGVVGCRNTSGEASPLNESALEGQAAVRRIDVGPGCASCVINSSLALTGRATATNRDV